MTDWLTEAARRPINLPELPEGLHYDGSKVMYLCRGCDQFKELEIEPAEFVFGDVNNLCGASPRCCP